MKTIDWILALTLTVLPIATISQGYPSGPVRMVLPFKPGTGIDTAAQRAVEIVDGRAQAPNREKST